MKALCIQHVPFEGMAATKNWFDKNNIHYEYLKFYEDYNLPEITGFDMIFVFGGPMSVNDDKKYPWIKDEILLIKKAIAARKKVVGICLGAQLIAKAMGSEVYANSHKEIGWYDLNFSSFDNLLLPGKLKVFHWHGETFDLAPGAKRIGDSAACPNQGFIYSNHVLAFQFHMEFNNDSLDSIIENCSDELLEGSEFIQSAEYIKSKASEYLKDMNNLYFQILDDFILSKKF